MYEELKYAEVPLSDRYEQIESYTENQQQFAASARPPQNLELNPSKRKVN